MKAVAEELDRGAVQAAPCGGICGLARPFGAAAYPGAAVYTNRWAASSMRQRLKILRAFRHLMSVRAAQVAEAISPALSRSTADTMASELLPLLDACKFLERKAERLLRPRRLGTRGRPLWLRGVWAEVHREPLGHVLVIGPANFPLFLTGVATLQALTAGNSVTWKPGAGGAAVAELVAQVLREAGLPEGTLTVTDESVDAARSALAGGADKVVFTGSSASGTDVLAALAGTATPAVVELSGADAIVVTPSAELRTVAKAVAFGLRLNGGAACMSPRRLFATPATMSALRPLLSAALAGVPAVRLEARPSAQLRAMLDEAVTLGAVLHGDWRPDMQGPLVVDSALPRMEITRSDVFAPVISLIEVDSMLHVPEAYAQCPYALTVAIFCGRGKEDNARVMARALKAGTVLINDIIAPTADPRIPFGGRGASGYGVTRGAEGLLEMTAIKTLLVRRTRFGGGMRHFEATRDEDAHLFAAMIAMVHGHGLAQRWAALRRTIAFARSR